MLKVSEMVIHEVAELTVTEYDPAESPVMDEVVAPLLHK
jgi:hypothetical protein